MCTHGSSIHSHTGMYNDLTSALSHRSAHFTMPRSHMCTHMYTFSHCTCLHIHFYKNSPVYKHSVRRPWGLGSELDPSFPVSSDSNAVAAIAERGPSLGRDSGLPRGGNRKSCPCRPTSLQTPGQIRPHSGLGLSPGSPLDASAVNLCPEGSQLGSWSAPT